MLLIVAAVILAAESVAPSGSSNPGGVVQPRHACAPATSTDAGDDAKKTIRPIPLAQLPPADAYNAVDRHVDGCSALLKIARFRTAARKRP